MNDENTEVLDSVNVDLKQIQKDLENGLNKTGDSEEKTGSESDESIPKKSVWDDKDFINDNALSFVLGLKNSAAVAFLAKGLGKTEKEMLSDLYEVTGEELKLYKKLLQDFIRENFNEYMDQIAKITNGEILAIAFLEIARFREARILVQASRDAGKKNE